jgi:hypothetical protein
MRDEKLLQEIEKVYAKLVEEADKRLRDMGIIREPNKRRWSYDR